MKRQQIRCPDCKCMVMSDDLREHVLMCKSYVTKVLPNTLKIADFLTRDYLQFLVAELDIAKERIQHRIDRDGDPCEGIRVVSGLQPQTRAMPHQKPPLKQIPISRPNVLSEQPTQQPIIPVMQTIGKSEPIPRSSPSPPPPSSHDVVLCMNCQTAIDVDKVQLFIYNFNCLHLLCVACVKSFALDKFVDSKGQLLCLAQGCKDLLPREQIQQVLGLENYEKLEQELLRATVEVIKCGKCKQEFILTEGEAKDAPKEDAEGKKLKPEMAQHYAKNRFVCPNPTCKQQQCKMCLAAPYHLGRTCSQNQQFLDARKCRYCRCPLQPGYSGNLGIRAFVDVCPRRQCQKLTKLACSKIHPCNHACLGIIRQAKCLPCLDQKCSSRKKVPHQQNQDSYCGICYVQDLKASPCVMSKCGHIFHYRCLEKRLNMRWLTPRIQFGFCHCPLCKEWIELAPQCPLSEVLGKNRVLMEDLREKAYKRLKFQKLQNDPKLTDSKSNFFKKPMEYAVAIYAYFECNKCKNPYFGGKKSCGDGINQQLNGSASQQYDATKLICPSCCPVDKKNCQTHGKQFLAFKCRFCCNISMWFCWGNTHFCDDCHNRQLKGEMVSKIPRDKLPKCEGQGKCPSGGSHGDNGSQFSIGCLLCKNYKQSSANF